MARIEYVGGIEFRSESPEALARWYTEKFGLATTFQYQGGHYGIMDTPAGPLHFGMTPRKDGSEGVGKNIALTFRVSDFSAYLAQLKAAGLRPLREMQDQEGRFAVFRDPEGNELLIWGD
jgi:predicted enzyme related to lactoylglutathione lyase